MCSRRFKNKTKWYVHIFPTTEFDWDCLKLDKDKKCLYVRHQYEFHSSLKVKVLPKFWCFNTDGIFSNSCASDVYKTVTEQIIDQIYHGIDNVVMSCGQNYSGKTFTMSGLHNQFELRGIIPRFISDLFIEEKIKQEEFLSQIWLSIVDVDNTTIHDLLSGPFRQCNSVKDVVRIKLNSATHCLELLFKAEAQRFVVEKKSYNAHYRSNVVTFFIKLASLHTHEPHTTLSKVHFVDLAGVETIGRNPLTSIKDQITQAQANVTKTLLQIFAIRSKKWSTGTLANHRVHKLTEYLAKSLSLTSCVKLICHIRPNHEDLMITLSLLKFGLSFKGMPMLKPEPNIEHDNERIIALLQEKVRSLEDDKLIRDLPGEISPMKITQERIDFVKRGVELFLKEEISENELISMVDDCRLILHILKDVDKERSKILKETVALQTESERKLSLVPDEKAENDEKSTKTSIRKKSIIKNQTGSLVSSIKHDSFGKSKSSQKTGKAGKDKKDKKLKVEEKPVLKSEEVQVNLIEPQSKLPILGSRESLWAEFIISRPEIQEILSKLNISIVENEKKLNVEKAKLDNIRQNLNTTHLALHELASYRHFEGKEDYDKEGRLILPEAESKLVKELRFLQMESDASEQKLLQAQLEWLEALKILKNKKETIDEEFKQFCISNNLLELNLAISSQEEISSKETHSLITAEPINHDELIREIYNSLQKKYLK